MSKITAKEREQGFRVALKDLLEDYGAEMEIHDDGKPYGLHSVQVTISMCWLPETDDSVECEFSEFVL